MTEYHKIDSVYKRDTKGKFILGDWSRPEFEYLADKPWHWTEKIDGTNIRLIWDGEKIKFGGRTDNAQLPNKLLANLTDHFHGQWTPGDGMFKEVFGDTPAVVYGEGYGAGIQKGGGNYSDQQWFIVFDIKIGDWWLGRENVVDIATKLGLRTVKQYEPKTLNDMIQSVFEGGLVYASAFDLPGFIPEGYVGTPTVPLFNRKGERIITKVKFKDFV